MRKIRYIAAAFGVFISAVAPSAWSAAVQHYRFSEPVSSTDVIDSLSSTTTGMLMAIAGATSFRSVDVPGDIVGVGTNTQSLQMTRAFGTIMSPFVFNQGGPPGNATLEFFFKMNNPDGHGALLWTNADTTADDNRYNFFWNAGFAGQPNTIGSDYRNNSGTIQVVPYSPPGGPLPEMSRGVWHHFAVVRRDLGGNLFQYESFLDYNSVAMSGIIDPGGLDPAFPTATSWHVNGRQGGASTGDGLDGLIDEIRFSDQALTPSQFLVAVIPPGTPRQWLNNTSGDWNNGGNWTPGIPNSNDATALFGPAIQSNATVFTNTDVTAKRIQFNNSTAKYVVAGAGTINLDDNLNVNAAIDVMSGNHEFQARLRLHDNTTATASAGTSLAINNALELNGKTLTITGPGSVSINNDIIAGTGGSVVNSASLSGTGTINGNFSNLPAGTLGVSIAGTGPHDVNGLNVTGTANLAGVLDVSLLGGFTPAGGQNFTVLTAANIVNSGLALSPSDTSMFSLNVGATSVILQAIGAGGLTGDYNRNGHVDAADYVIWRKTLGANVTPGTGADGDNNGSIGPSDYNVWRQNFGRSAGSAAGAFAGVPEPATTVLFFLAAAVGSTARRRMANH